MSAQEYYQSTPGQELSSQDSFWKGGNPAPAPSKDDDTQSPPLLVLPPKLGGIPEDFFSPQPPGFSLTDPPLNFDPVTSPTKPIPIPPPQASGNNDGQSPPVGSLDSGLTDDSDSSLVHVHHPSHNNHNTSPPPNRHHHNNRHHRSRSDSLSLTHSNLQQHNNGISNGSSVVVSPPRDYGGLSSTRKRLRAKELATHGKDTLIQMLIRQENQFDESRKLLRGAMDKLEQYKLDLVEANNHCRRLERACQKLTDERMMMHTQVTEGVAKARLETDAARQELSVCKLRLEHTELALVNANTELREMKSQRDTARVEAEAARREAHRLREDHNVRLARELGRQEGYKEGVVTGRIQGVSQSSGGATPRPTAAPGSDPLNASTSNHITTNTTTNANANANANAGANETTVENPNTSLSSSTTSHRRSSGSSHRSRVSQAEFAEAVERARRETEARLQHELELRLAQERERLKVRNLELEQQRQKEIQEVTDRMRSEVEQLRRHEAIEVARLRERENQREEEVRAERDRIRELELEKEKEKELKEREQQERLRERAERERERTAAERDRQRLEEARERERRAALERERERDRAVAEATAQAALATVNANAVATANAARSTSETSDSGSDARSSSLRSYLRDSDSPIPPQPYIPMPRPPFNMSIPTPAPASSIIAPAMSMPEPTINSSMVNTRPSSRATSQPSLPTTIPARRNRRASMDSQSSISTVTAVDSLLSFPHAVPGRTPSSGSVPRTVPGIAGSNGSNGHGHRPSSTSTSRNGVYTRPGGTGIGGGPYGGLGVSGREALRDIPEDASLRISSPEVSTNRSSGGRGGGGGGGHMSGPVIPPFPVVYGTTPSTGSSSQRRRKEQQAPSWVLDGTRGEGSSQQYPVVPNIRVEPDAWGSESSGDGRYMPTVAQPLNSSYLNPNQGYQSNPNLRRSDSTNSARPSITSISSYEINVEPPSPTSLSSGRHGTSHEQPPPSNQFLSPNQQPIPIPQVQTQPVLPRRADSPPLPVRITSNNSASGPSRGRRSGTTPSGRGNPPTEPNSPVIPPVDPQSLPPGFVPHVFTPHSATPAALPAELPPGFVPQAITDSITGMTTPLAGLTNLPAVGAGASGTAGGGESNSRRQSVYGNPNAEARDDGGAVDWGGGGWDVAGGGGGGGGGWDVAGGGGGKFSPYTSSSPLPSGPPVIPKGVFDDADGSGGAGPSGSRATPNQRPRSIYGSGTPGASTRNLPGGGTPAGGGVYQNPLRQEEGEDGEGLADDLVARNTRINATAPAPVLAGKAGKKKKGGKRNL